MHISEVGQNLIKTFEGATLSKNIVQDLEEQISNLITAPVNQNQFDALFSFASFNFLQKEEKWCLARNSR